VLAIQKQPGANTVEVVDSVKGRLPMFRAQVPAAINMELLNDRSVSIRDSVADVQETLAIAIALVVLVIFLFLRSASATIIPALLMGGMVGRVFREFAVTIAIAIIISGFVSLTLTPMLCARVLRGHHEGEKQNIVLRIFERMFASWLRAYEWSLERVLRYKSITLAVTFGTLIATIYLYVIIPKGFFPTEDTGFIAATTEGASDVSFTAMVERQR